MTTLPVYLETYIVPVCGFKEVSSSVLIRAVFGTAFFINDSGTFLTAQHVIDEARRNVAELGGFLGLCVRPPGAAGSVACPVITTDAAAAPYDVCVGTIDAGFPTTLTLSNISVHTWSDVTTFGYPTTAQNVTPNEFWIYGRGLKGYLHRHAKAGQLQGGRHPDAFETSFAMPKGLSGAPLFVYNNPRDIVIGVCVGVNSGETTEFMLEEVQDNGEVRTERRVRVEEYGLAHDLRPLLDFRPVNLDGQTLVESARFDGGGL